GRLRRRSVGGRYDGRMADVHQRFTFDGAPRVAHEREERAARSLGVDGTRVESVDEDDAVDAWSGRAFEDALNGTVARAPRGQPNRSSAHGLAQSLANAPFDELQ